MNWISIDPGASGGIAWVYSDGIVAAAPMPEGMTAQADLLRHLAATANIQAIVEKVGGYMPGNSGPAAATFARHCGNLDAMLYCLGIPLAANPTPQKWMAGLGTWPTDKAERKQAIKEAMARRYPYLKVTLKTADALGILSWWMDRNKSGRAAV